MKVFSVIGAGRLGTSLAAGLIKKGWTLEAFADRIPAAARESVHIVGQGTATTDLGRAVRRTEVVFVCVPDDAIASVARLIARRTSAWPGRFVYHSSGLLAAAALDPLKKQGAMTGSLHPVQTFPRKDGTSRQFRGIYWDIEGSLEAVEFALGIVRDLGGHGILIDAQSKPLYHAACSLASNAFVSLERASAALLAKAGLGPAQAEAVLLPLVQGTLQGVKELGLAASLTGPISRGDLGTVRQHMAALTPYPRQREIYVALAAQAVELLAGVKLSPEKVRAWKRLLEGK